MVLEMHLGVWNISDEHACMYNHNPLFSVTNVKAETRIINKQIPMTLNLFA